MNDIFRGEKEAYAAARESRLLNFCKTVKVLFEKKQLIPRGRGWTYN